MAIFGVGDASTSYEEDFVQDPWSALDYKKILSTDHYEGVSALAPDWMVPSERRRIQAYTAFRAIRANNARMLLRATSPKQRRAKENRREYGDAGLLIDTETAAVLGDQQSIAVKDAERYDEDGPAESRAEEYRLAAERQEFLRQWAEDERLITKLFETERDTATDGDGIYCLEWSTKTGRPRLITREAATYFPVLSDVADNQHPKKLHFAWQELEEDPRSTKILIHRITYELREVDVPYRVPWEEELANEACFLSEAIFEFDREHRHFDDLVVPVEILTDDEGEIWDRNLGIDFMPVVHVPNTVSEKDHFGRSTLAPLLQILDDLQATDSDLQQATALTGSPTLWLARKSSSSTSRVSTQLNRLRNTGDVDSPVSPASTASMELGPDVVLDLGEGGQAGVLSGADGLAGLASTRDDLIERLLVTARTAAAAVGRVETDKVAAGVILALSFGPMKAKIDEKRLVRKDKYRLPFKFVQRLYWKEGVLDSVLLTDLVFGSFLPTDRKEIVDLVIRLLEAKLISRRTGMAMLQEAGIPIIDPVKEEEEIDKRDYEGANLLADLGATEAAAKMLDVEIDEKPTQVEAAGMTEFQQGTSEIDEADLDDKA